MSIPSSIMKLNKIKAEIKRRSIDLRNLRKEKKRIEQTILEFLDKSGHTAVKYRDEIAIIKETKKKCNRKYQNPTMRHSAATNILKSMGIDNSSEVAKAIIEAMKGPKEDSAVLKIKNIK